MRRSSAMRGLGGAVGPTAAAFGPGEPPPGEEVVEENSGGEEDEEELELGLCLGSKKQQLQAVAPSPCRILTARNLQPAAALSPDSSVSSSSPAAASGRAKAEEGPAPAASPGTLTSGHPQRFLLFSVSLVVINKRIQKNCDSSRPKLPVLPRCVPQIPDFYHLPANPVPKSARQILTV